MSLVGSKRVAPARRPSPARDGATSGDRAEETFQQKLQEIKRMRMTGSSARPEECSADKPPLPPPAPGSGAVVPKTVKTVNGLKTFLKCHGDWVEVVSKSGKVYYYNKRTLVNQWKKPEDWLKEEERLNTPPPAPAPPPLPPDDPEPVMELPPLPEDNTKLKLKLMTMKKIQRLKNPENLPLAYQKNTQKRLDDSDSDEEGKKPKLTVQNAFEDPDAMDEDQKLAKLDPEDEIGHIRPDPVVDEPKKEVDPELKQEDTSAIQKKDPKDCRKFDPKLSGPERAENLIEGCAAQLAFKNITSMPGSAPGAVDAGLGVDSAAGNPTYFTEYNLPCCLRRCKFPKEQDVLHELQLNKMKRRTYIPPPLIDGLDPKLSHLAQEAQMEQFMAEVKNYNNHDRLMTSRMDNVLVYKIPDEVWER